MSNKTSIAIAAAAIAGFAALGWAYRPGAGTQGAEAPQPREGAAMVEVVQPASFGPAEETGKAIFEASCAKCHGKSAAGQEGVAPPLVHKIYEPSHHGDEAFQMAAARGVQSHHWRFGNMPPVEGLTRGDVAQVVAYVRALQRANGIN